MEGKNEWPKPRKVNDTKEDIPTRHEAKSVMFKSELPTRLIEFPIFAHHFWQVPQLFFITGLKGIACSCTVSSSFGRIRPSKFNEP